MTSRSSTAVVVVNFASSTLLLSNLTLLSTSDVEVVVVDNFSSLAERERVSALCSEQGWLAVLLDTNSGFGGGVNCGVQAALARGAEVVVALNPDAVADDATVLELAAAARRDPCSLVSPRIVDETGATWFAGADLYLDDGTTAGAARRASRSGRPRKPWATGACFAMSAFLWNRVGGFDERYFMYWEDIDLSHRILGVGGQLILRDDLVVSHSEGQTQGKTPGSRAKSALYYRYNIRNRLLYGASHLDDPQLRRWTLSAPRVAYAVLLQGGRRQLLKPTPWLAATRGMAQGLAEVHRVRSARRITGELPRQDQSTSRTAR